MDNTPEVYNYRDWTWDVNINEPSYTDEDYFDLVKNC